MRTMILWLAAVLGVRSAAIAQTTLNVSEDLVRLGIASTNIIPNQPNLDAGPLFFRAVLYAGNHQINRVIADTGAYYFLSQQYANTHLAWDKLSNLTLDLQGSDLHFTFPLATGISLTNATNIMLQNFTVDYDPLPFTQVRVVSVNPAHQQIQFAVDGNWQNPSVLNAVFNVPNGSVDVHIFRSGRPIIGANRLHASTPIGSGQFTVSPDPGLTPSDVVALIRPGDTAVLCMRNSATAVSTARCTGCTVRNIAIYSGVAVGLEGGLAESSVFDHIYVIPKPGTDRLVSNFTGLQLSGGLGNQIRQSRMIRTMDNALEFGARVIGSVQSQTDNRTFVVKGLVTSDLSFGLAVPNGSPVSFQRLTDGAVVASAVTASPVAPPYSGQPPQATFTFDRDLPQSIVGTLMFGTDPDSRAANSVFERNAVEEETDCCNGFFVVGVGESTFHGNYAQRTAMSGVQTNNALQPGNLNSPPSSNFAISNNVIDGANWTRTGYPLAQLGSISVDATNAAVLLSGRPDQNISITGNFIADSGSAAVWLGNTNGGSVNGNYFLNPNTNPAVESAVSFFGPAAEPLVVNASQNISTVNNIVDQTSGRMWVTDTQYDELAAYAPGSVIRLNAYELGTLPNPSITISDADGNTTPAIVQQTTAHAVDVLVPSSAGLGGAYLTLTAGGLKYFGTLFLDSQDNIPALNGCTYEVSPSSTSFGAGGGNLPILVITQAGCAYQVLTTGSFVSSSANAGGTGVITAGFNANSGAARTATIEVAGQAFTVSQTAPSTVRPTIQAIYDSWNYTSGIAPGAWVTITGTALAPMPPRTWNLNEVQILPASLGGVTVSFNGTLAALYYVSPTQINVLVPATVGTGSVQVVVQSNGVSSIPFTVTGTTTLPAIYAPPNSDGSTFFVTAALAGTATLVGNSATDPRVVRAAQPGDLLDLYMIGLGATLDPSKFVSNQLFSGAYPVSAPVTAFVGGEAASVLFAGLTSPGLYLVRIAVPSDLGPGSQPIQISAAASRTRSSLVLVLSAP